MYLSIMPRHDKHHHPKHHGDDLALVDQRDRDRRHGPDHDGKQRRHRRMLDHGEMRFVLLDLLAERPRHGYEAIKAIEDASGGDYSPSPGVIYPTLAMLEDLGHATTEGAAGTRRQFTITETGSAFLEQNRAQADTIRARLTAEANRSAEPAPPIRRAIENLRLALRLRLAAPIDPAQTEGLATLLDDTAKRIETI